MLTWDRSHDWVLQRCWHNLTRVAIQFRQARPSITEVAALRRCVPRFRNQPPAVVRNSADESGRIDLGALPTREARELIERFQCEGLQVIVENASSVGYLPYDRTSGCAWLIEDDAEANRVAQEMISAGVPVQDVEVC